jgi:hypothetical protein
MIGYEVHPASYPMGTWGCFPGSKAARALEPRLRMSGAIPPFTQYVFMAWYLVKGRDNLPFAIH